MCFLITVINTLVVLHPKVVYDVMSIRLSVRKQFHVRSVNSWNASLDYLSHDTHILLFNILPHYITITIFLLSSILLRSQLTQLSKIQSAVYCFTLQCSCVYVMSFNVREAAWRRGSVTDSWSVDTCQSWVRVPSKAPVVSLSKKLYSNCLVLVGSRNRFDLIYISQKIFVSQSN